MLSEIIIKAAANKAALTVASAKIKKIEPIVMNVPDNRVSLEFDRLAQDKRKHILAGLKQK